MLVSLCRTWTVAPEEYSEIRLKALGHCQLACRRYWCNGLYHRLLIPVSRRDNWYGRGCSTKIRRFGRSLWCRGPVKDNGVVVDGGCAKRCRIRKVGKSKAASGGVGARSGRIDQERWKKITVYGLASALTYRECDC